MIQFGSWVLWCLPDAADMVVEQATGGDLGRPVLGGELLQPLSVEGSEVFGERAEDEVRARRGRLGRIRHEVMVRRTAALPWGFR